MSQVIPLFPRRATTEKEDSRRDYRETPMPGYSRGRRRETAAAIRYCLESLLHDAETFDLGVTKAALVVAIAAVKLEVD